MGGALVACLLLAACIRIDVTQKIDASGKMQFSMTYDFTKLAELSKETGSSSEAEDNCAAFMKRNTEEKTSLQNVRCVDKAPHVIQLTGTAQLKRREFIVRKVGTKTMFLYRLANAMSTLDPELSSMNAQSSSVDPETEKMGEELAESMFQGTFVITMPGRIISSPVGKITGNSVTIEITDSSKMSGVIRAESQAGAQKSSSPQRKPHPRG